MGFLFLLIGILGFIWCIIPAFLYGIIGLGNLTGMGVFAAFILIGIMWKKLVSFVTKVRKRKSGRVITNAIYTFLGLFFMLVVYLTILMITGINRASENGATVVVLGCQVNSYGPTMMLRERLDKAYEYLTDNQEAKCVLSGGQGKNEPMPEAKAMYDYLIDKGIDKDRLYIEDKSMDTVENIEYTMQLIKENGLNENILIISNEYHLYRAGYIAAAKDVNYGTLAANTHWWMFMTYYVRELYGILAECVLGM